MKLVKKTYRKDLQGTQYYSNWRIDKNISWYNITNTFFGVMHANITLMFLWNWKNYKTYMNLFDTKYWLPPRYADNYYEAVYK